MRRDVAAVAGKGEMSHEEIAIALGISRNTLEKYFEKELSEGALKRRFEVIAAMYHTAKRGNVAAQKAYLAGSPRLAAPPLKEEKPLGKKEQAAADATTAQIGTEWNDLLPASARGPASLQ